MGNRLKDKVVVVTGATRGIGKGIARMAASEGARVAVSGRNRAEGEEAAERIRSDFGSEALYVSGDLSEAAECRRLIAETERRFGRVDGLVNNTGIFPRGGLLETDEELYERVFNVNVKSAFFCSRFAVEAMLRTGGGSIVHIGSTHGYKGAADLAAYACSKGAMHTLSRHIAANYAGQGIRSNWVTVGWVASEGELDRFTQGGQSAQDLEALAREKIPSGRLQTVDDMAYGAVFLLSDEASQVTGTDLHIAGAFNL